MDSDYKNINSVVAQIRKIFDSANISYDYQKHEPVITSMEAERVRPNISIAQGTKALIVKATFSGKVKKFVMIVLPGDKRFDTKKARKEIGAQDLRFATEKEVEDVTKGVQVGGVPPFGNLFGIKTYADKSVFLNNTIAFSAGDRRVSISVDSKEYRKIAEPIVADLAN